jgi:TRAP transporter TAXI family solute receptor
MQVNCLRRFAVAFAAALALATTAAPFAAQSRVTFSTGSVGGSTYTWAAMASNILSQHIDGVTFASRSGGTTENILLVESGQITAAAIGAIDFWAAKKGASPTPQNTRIRTLWYMFPSYVSFAVPKNDPATTIQQLKGKRLSIGARDGGVWAMWQVIKEPLGLTDSEFNLQYLGSGASATAFKDGQIDAFMSMGGLPFPPLMEIAASARGAKVILPTAAELDKLEKASKLLKRARVAPGLLPGIDKETETITTGFFIIVRDDFPEELAYKIAKVLDTNHAELVKAYKAAEASTAAATVANDYLPLHPGTRRYLVEKGLIK